MAVWAGSALACGGIGVMSQETARSESLCGEDRVSLLVVSPGAQQEKPQILD